MSSACCLFLSFISSALLHYVLVFCFRSALQISRCGKTLKLSKLVFLFLPYLRQEVLWSGVFVYLSVCLFATLVVICRKIQVRNPWNLAHMLIICAVFCVNFREVKVKVQGQNRRTNRNSSPVVKDIFTKVGSPTDIRLPEVILTRNITFDKILDGCLAGGGCAVWVFSS